MAAALFWVAFAVVAWVYAISPAPLLALEWLLRGDTKAAWETGR